MSDKFGDGRDPYFYAGRNVMSNRLGIHQAKQLEETAYEFTALRAATLELGPVARACRTSAPSIVISTRISLNGPVRSVRSTSIRAIRASVILTISRTRATP
ncbi:cell filamentation protein [Pseudescherichia vulneris]|nr:cell filamentation protein [Pseudescherichia vulneris]